MGRAYGDESPLGSWDQSFARLSGAIDELQSGTLHMGESKELTGSKRVSLGGGWSTPMYRSIIRAPMARQSIIIEGESLVRTGRDLSNLQ